MAPTVTKRQWLFMSALHTRPDLHNRGYKYLFLPKMAAKRKGQVRHEQVSSAKYIVEQQRWQTKRDRGICKVTM